MIGEVINYRYEILETIGEGAFFTVYKCKDKVLNRLVALKILNREYSDNKEFVARIVDNARRCNKLNHPAIAKILECEDSGGVVAIVCDYARGVSVYERVRRESAFPVAAAVDIMLKVLDALEYAHAAGIVHGDLRPQDIIVSPDGEVKITDFGFAEALRASPEIAEKFSMRSVRYQAPELTEGAAFSASNDIYAFGAIFYEMLAGRPAFDGPNTLAIAVKKVKEAPVPVRQIRPEVPKSLNDLIMRCLQADPGQRYRDVSQIKQELSIIKESLLYPLSGVGARKDKGAQQEYQTIAQPEGSRWKEIAILSLVFVCVVLVVMFAVFYFSKSGKRIPVPQFIGMTWEEAADLAKKSGLTLVDDGRVHSDVYEAGKICEQVPDAGQYVTSGKPEVRVRISDGPAWTAVPDLTNMSEGDARELAIKNGFNIGKVTEEYSDTVPPNSVIRQDPEPGVQRSPNSNIDIVLSKGPKPVEPQPTPPAQTENTEQVGKEQTFTVEVTVPEGGDSPHNIKVLVKDDTGENTPIDEMQPPGSYSYEITTYGEKPKIEIYLDGKLIKTERP